MINILETRVPCPLEGLGPRGRHHGAGGEPGLPRINRKIHGQLGEVEACLRKAGKVALTDPKIHCLYLKI